MDECGEAGEALEILHGPNYVATSCHLCQVLRGKRAKQFSRDTGIFLVLGASPDSSGNPRITELRDKQTNYFYRSVSWPIFFGDGRNPKDAARH